MIQALEWLSRQPELAGLDVGGVPLRFEARDGAGGSEGRTRPNSISSSWREIVLDPADIPQPLNWEDGRTRVVLCHEYRHCWQALSFWRRVRIWWDNLTQPYEERWHERDAHEVGNRLAARWAETVRA